MHHMHVRMRNYALHSGRGGLMLLHFDLLGDKVAPPFGPEKFFDKGGGCFEREADE